MEDIIENLEEQAGELSADLSTEAALLQESANNVLAYEENSEEYKIGLNNLKTLLSEFNSDYVEAEAIVAISDRMELGKAEEQREEEVRLAREKYFSSNIENPYSGRVGDAISAHQERQSEARDAEILAHGTPIQNLRNNLELYKEVLSALEETFEELNTGITYEAKEYDSEIIEEPANNNSSEAGSVEANWEPGRMWKTI